jgi:2-dehydropantoate 2-reductase
MIAAGLHERRPGSRIDLVRVLVYGAGVIGRIYGGRLARAGHDATLLARGPATAELAANGVRLLRGDETVEVHPRVIEEVPDGSHWDVILLTVRRDQVEQALPVLDAVSADRVVVMLNQPVDVRALAARIGIARTVLAFPGVGGRRLDGGTIRYVQIPQQPTTVGRNGLEQPVVALLRTAAFPVAVSSDMTSWLKTHAVFITALGSAILIAGGESTALAADRGLLTEAVAAVREGFRALRRQRIAVAPTPLRVLFTVLPRIVAVRYWQRELRGPVGTDAIAPHLRASRHTEFPVLCDDVRRMMAGHGPTPRLDRLLDAVS